MKKYFLILILGAFMSLWANEEILLKSSNAYELVKRNKYEKNMNTLAQKAKAILIFPDVTKVGLVLGGLHGEGVMILKINNSWQNVLGVSISGGSIGLQIGYKNANLVLFVLKESLIEDIKNTKITLDAGISFAFGDRDKTYSTMTDIKFTKDIYAFTDNSGFFAGVSFGGAVISNEIINYTGAGYAVENLRQTLNKQ